MRPRVVTLLQYRKGKVVPVALTITSIALLANLLLVASYVMELRKQQVLVSEVEATRQALADYSRPVTFQRLLAENEIALVAEQNAFPDRISGSQVTRELHNLARSRGLTVMETGSEPGETREVGQHSYRELLVVAQVSGSRQALQAFLRDLEEGALTGIRISEVSITRLALPNTGVARDDLSDQSSERYIPALVASLAISVYERQGSID